MATVTEDSLILLELERRWHFRHEAARSYGRCVRSRKSWNAVAT
jgi:hypothetical protein